MRFTPTVRQAGHRFATTAVVLAVGVVALAACTPFVADPRAGLPVGGCGATVAPHPGHELISIDRPEGTRAAYVTIPATVRIWWLLTGATRSLVPDPHGPQQFQFVWQLYHCSHSLVVFGLAFGLAVPPSPGVLDARLGPSHSDRHPRPPGDIRHPFPLALFVAWLGWNSMGGPVVPGSQLHHARRCLPAVLLQRREVSQTTANR